MTEETAAEMTAQKLPEWESRRRRTQNKAFRKAQHIMERVLDEKPELVEEILGDYRQGSTHQELAREYLSHEFEMSHSIAKCAIGMIIKLEMPHDERRQLSSEHRRTAGVNNFHNFALNLKERKKASQRGAKRRFELHGPLRRTDTYDGFSDSTGMTEGDYAMALADAGNDYTSIMQTVNSIYGNFRTRAAIKKHITRERMRRRDESCL